MRKITNLTEAFNNLKDIKLKEDLNPNTVRDYIYDYVSMEDLGLMAYKWMSTQDLFDMLVANGYDDFDDSY